MAKRTASAKKQARAGARRAVRNRSVKSAVKTRVTRARRAVAEHDVDAAREIGLAAVSGLDRAAEKGILHPNNAARRKSRLMKLLNGRTGGGDRGQAVRQEGHARQEGRACQEGCTGRERRTGQEGHRQAGGGQKDTG